METLLIFWLLKDHQIIFVSIKYNSWLFVYSAHSSVGFLLNNLQLAFLDPDIPKYFSLNIYEVKNLEKGFIEAVPQAAMAGALYCQQYK